LGEGRKEWPRGGEGLSPTPSCKRKLIIIKGEEKGGENKIRPRHGREYNNYFSKPASKRERGGKRRSVGRGGTEKGRYRALPHRGSLPSIRGEEGPADGRGKKKGLKDIHSP